MPEAIQTKNGRLLEIHFLEEVVDNDINGTIMATTRLQGKWVPCFGCTIIGLGTSAAWIQDIKTFHQLLRKGIALAVLGAMAKRYSGAGYPVQCLSLQVRKKNKEAKALYAKAGYRETAHYKNGNTMYSLFLKKPTE